MKRLDLYPEIAYLKWDANNSIQNVGSLYLPMTKQANVYVDYQLGLLKVLKRIREKYPNVVMQDCASGGGRANYGLLPYFDEFWVSDNTDALQRVYIQWGRACRQMPTIPSRSGTSRPDSRHARSAGNNSRAGS